MSLERGGQRLGRGLLEPGREGEMLEGEMLGRGVHMPGKGRAEAGKRC